MNKHVKWPSIELFKHLVRSVKAITTYDGTDEEGRVIYCNRPLPTLTLHGTVKLHGTNAGLRVSEHNVAYQNRGRDLSLTSDNAGFYLWASQHEASFKLWGDMLRTAYSLDEVVIFGEWCGGNIQKGVALNKLPKMFVVFGGRGLRYGSDGIVELTASQVMGESVEIESVYNILEFPTYEVVCDFNNPEYAQNEIEKLVLQVEEECPVGKHFGVSGIGEGIVFTTFCEGQLLRFKAKGEKHSKSKVSKHLSVNIEDIESIKKFVDLALTEPRLKQGLDYLREMNLEVDPKNLGVFIKWCNGDVMKEMQLEIVENQLDPKKIAKEVSNRARVWFFNQES